MRREFVALESSMRRFIEQPDYPTLLITASDSDVAVPTKVLNNWDRQWESHIFLIFPYDCHDVADYLRQSMEALALQIDAANAEHASKSHPTWSPLPLSCMDPRQPPAKRLQAAIEHVRTLITDPVDIVWGLLPGTIGDPAGYKAMIALLLAVDGYEQWMDGHRFIIRDNSAKPFLLPDLQREKIDSVLGIRIDFSAAKAADTQVKTVNNLDLPLPERMQALTELAALDLAYKRYDQALEKYDLLHAYHVQQNDAIGQALALGGAGDVAMRRANLSEAKKRYQQALAVAAPTGNLTPMLNLLMATGDCCLRLNHFEEAEGYLSLANKVAGKLTSPFAKVMAMENLGVAQLSMHKANDAVTTWVAAKELAKQFGCIDQCQSVLDRLIALYTKVGMNQQAKEYRSEKEWLGKEEAAVQHVAAEAVVAK